ncbi:MAG: prepilin-type N-terminal cleavage/methylation domain-containing protein [Planctomycetota bacterium]
MSRYRGSGFTLVELLIVVIILGILAGVVIPQFSSASIEAKEAALMTDLAALRNAIDLYKVQHNDVYPGTISGTTNWANFQTHLTTQTKKDGTAGTDFGPYLRTGVPKNPFNSLNTGTIGAVPATADDTSGWYYNNTTGEIRANTSGTGPSGVDYIDL